MDMKLFPTKGNLIIAKSTLDLVARVMSCWTKANILVRRNDEPG